MKLLNKDLREIVDSIEKVNLKVNKEIKGKSNEKKNFMTE